MKPILNRLLENISITYHVLTLLKVQFFVCVIASVLLIFPGQILEIYRLLFEDLSRRWPQAVMAITGLGFLIFMVWYSGRWMTLSLLPSELNLVGLKSVLLRWLPRAFAVIPGLLLGLFFLVSPARVGAQTAVVDLFWVRMIGVGIIVLSLLLLIGMIFRTRFFGNAGKYHVGVGSFQKFAVRSALFLPVLLLVLDFISPIEFPKFVGTLFFTSVFLGVLTFVLSWFSLIAKQTGFPVTFVVIGFAVVWSSLDMNDNHKVRTVNSKTSATEYQVEYAFTKWLEGRKDFEYYKSQKAKYPVYIVAAEGGGIYAAYHAASFLARMQDICPAFSGHIFAISGVSGGSIGSALFAGMLNEAKMTESKQGFSEITAPCSALNGNTGTLEKSVDQILSNDLLSPLVAATLTKDFVQAFIPYPIDRLDRARALEDAVLSAWQSDGRDPDALMKSVSDSWSPTGNTPALVLNTTHVETGQRVVVSPFKLIWPDYDIKTMDLYLENDRGLSLVTASALSARFTYITPAGWLPFNSKKTGTKKPSTKARFVDGGYFENSGVDTAMDMIEVLAPIAKVAGAEIRLISLQYKDAPSNQSYAFGEALSPVRALLGTRADRGRLATHRARTQLAGRCPVKSDDKSRCDGDVDLRTPFRVSVIHDGEGKLPLGWLLSHKSREIISGQIGWPKKCVLQKGIVGSPISVNNNACNLKFIQTELEDGITR